MARRITQLQRWAVNFLGRTLLPQKQSQLHSSLSTFSFHSNSLPTTTLASIASISLSKTLSLTTIPPITDIRPSLTITFATIAFLAIAFLAIAFSTIFSSTISFLVLDNSFLIVSFLIVSLSILTIATLAIAFLVISSIAISFLAMSFLNYRCFLRKCYFLFLDKYCFLNNNFVSNCFYIIDFFYF